MGKLNLQPLERIGRESSVLTEEKVFVTSGEKKAGSQGDRCSFRHVTQDCAQKPEHTAATLSEPALSRGRSASGKKSIRGKVTMDPFAAKFEDRSHEETGRQQRCAQSEAWDVAKNIYKLLENDRAKFFSLTKKYVLPSASSRES